MVARRSCSRCMTSQKRWWQLQIWASVNYWRIRPVESLKCLLSISWFFLQLHRTYLVNKWNGNSQWNKKNLQLIQSCWGLELCLGKCCCLSFCLFGFHSSWIERVSILEKACWSALWWSPFLLQRRPLVLLFVRSLFSPSCLSLCYTLMDLQHQLHL